MADTSTEAAGVVDGAGVAEGPAVGLGAGLTPFGGDALGAAVPQAATRRATTTTSAVADRRDGGDRRGCRDAAMEVMRRILARGPRMAVS
jgi:hypothetical protein